MSPKLKVLVGVLVGSLVLDQGSKWWVQQNLSPDAGRVVVIPNWLELIHAENPGAAWSTLADSPYRLWVFGTFTLVAVIALIQMFRSLEPDERLRAASTGLILSGAIGNAIDRMSPKHTVTDFIKVFAGTGGARDWLIQNLGTNVWPIFNIADSAIVVGVILFGLEFLFQKDKSPSTEENVGPNPMHAPGNSPG